MQKNEIFEADVLDLTHEGLGVVRVSGFPVFVENALPGETIRGKIVKVGKQFAFGRVEELLVTSPHRLLDVKRDYLRTGIADLAHLDYAAQLAFKRQQVVVALSKNAGLSDFPVEAVIGAQEPLHYRNKAQIPVREIAGEIQTGFFRKNSHELIAIEDFYIQEPTLDRLILRVRDLAREMGLSAYDETSKKGLLRNLVLRRGAHTGEIMLVFVATAFDARLRELADTLHKEEPKLVSILVSRNTTSGNAILGADFEVLYGRDTIRDTMLGKSFDISAAAFYQVNTSQAERLYQAAYDFAELKASDVIVDAYAGIGTIGLCASDQVAEIYGMEVVPEAVVDAQHNAVLNGVAEKAHYEVGKAEEVMPKWLSRGVRADVIFVDPPRKGLEASFIETAASMGARQIVYISCNPATFARDVKLLSEQGYALESVQPVDLFPQTHHIELVGDFHARASL
ncbi:MAG: 23S rRNA (uracil(1939)-C(5))-methyltransferase RlmD [Streptococcaceae bacterium]|jgi:23S rRNA (uracil1939-C5)-methyltransferase|nr:23S rRNA (uracil(1939)-C(5))-methyltransferase RlmD [Streptococcaceae bacterium]